jgi:uncharacterized SAM-binding protein YcdF (DUF218 family)
MAFPGKTSLPTTAVPGSPSGVVKQQTRLVGATRRPRRWIKLLIWVCAVMVVGMSAALFFASSLLLVDSGPVQGDVIVVLGGGSGERPVRAAALFKEQAAPLVLLTGYGDCESNQRQLVAAGVPAAAIVMECQSHSTKQNAQLTVPFLRGESAHRVILVTSWYHSRRAIACFRHFAPGYEYYSRPSYYGFDRSEWSATGVGRFVKAEYLKTFGYLLCYGVWPA